MPRPWCDPTIGPMHHRTAGLPPAGPQQRVQQDSDDGQASAGELSESSERPVTTARPGRRRRRASWFLGLGEPHDPVHWSFIKFNDVECFVQSIKGYLI